MCDVAHAPSPPQTPPSRPKNVGEVACQEEVVATLTKSIETANARPLPPPLSPPLSRLPLSPSSLSSAAAAPAVLRPARHWQDVHRARNRAPAVRPRALQGARVRAERVRRARHLDCAHQDQGVCVGRGRRARPGVPQPALQAPDSGRGARRRRRARALLLRAY